MIGARVGVRGGCVGRRGPWAYPAGQRRFVPSLPNKGKPKAPAPLHASPYPYFQCLSWYLDSSYWPSTWDCQFWVNTFDAVVNLVMSLINFTLAYSVAEGNFAARSAGILPASASFW